MESPINPISVSEAARRLRGGGVVIVPTETVYGLAGVFSDISAITRIFKVKERPLFNPLIVHVAELSQVEALAEGISPLASRLMERFWPGPLTLVLPKKPSVPDLVTAGLDTVAVRMPSHPIALEVIRQTGSPLAAPSANFFGRLSATSLEDLDIDLWKKTDGAVDGGRCRVGVESTVVQVSEDSVTLLRHGGVPVEKLREVVSRIEEAREESTPAEQRRSPGRILSHYAPRTPLFFVDKAPNVAGKKVGFLSFRERPKTASPSSPCEILSPAGDLDEAARALFGAMKRLDREGLDLILTERFPERGLGSAINDRLERASSSVQPL